MFSFQFQIIADRGGDAELYILGQKSFCLQDRTLKLILDAQEKLPANWRCGEPAPVIGGRTMIGARQRRSRSGRRGCLHSISMLDVSG